MGAKHGLGILPPAARVSHLATYVCSLARRAQATPRNKQLQRHGGVDNDLGGGGGGKMDGGMRHGLRPGPTSAELAATARSASNTTANSLYRAAFDGGSMREILSHDQ